MRTKIGCHDTPINKDDVDVWAIFCPDTDKIYYINPKNYNKSLQIRIDKNKYKEKHKAEDLLTFPPK